MHGILILVLQRFFYFAVVIGLMVLIHEFGHYAVAKLLGVRVEQFAIGFGKRLIGFRRGDRIVQIDGIQNPTWEQVEIKQLLSANQPLSFTVERDNQRIQGSVVPIAVTSDDAGSARWYPPVIMGDLERDMPGAKAGLREGDKIVSMDGQPLASIQEMIDHLQQTKSKPIQVDVERQNSKLAFTITPVLADTPGLTEKHYRLGFSMNKVSKLSFQDAFAQSLVSNRKNSVLLLELLGKLVQHKASIKSFSGPIGIAQKAGEAAEEKGWIPLLMFCILISIIL